ncbi:MAG TPA: trypsin-like peptidase domain-containing protein [Acidimicrobiia bacterium]
MSDSDPTDHQPSVPPPWPTARPGEPTPASADPTGAGPVPAPPAADPTQPTPTFAAPTPPPWPAPEAQPVRPRGRTTALVAVVGVVALLAGAAGAAVGVAVSDSGGGGTSPSSFVAPSNPFGNSNGGSSEGGQLGGGSGSGSGSSGNVNVDVSGIAKKVNPAIVNIETTLSGGGEAAGTGMVLTSSGEVLTNNHVINGATKIRVELGITGKTYTAKVVGYDSADDVALIKLDNASGMKTISTETSVSKNDKVVAIGNALGHFGTPSAVGGTVSALHQKVTAGDGGDSETLSDMIRIAASIQPGDSGGALVNESGKVIGMNTAADAGSGQSPFGGQFGSQTGTTGFAIPIGNAIKVVDEIRDGDTSNGAHIGDRALLGVVLQESSSNSPFGDSSGNGGNGAAVSDVSSGSPADDAGIQQGDTITGVGSKSVDSADQLRTVLNGYHPGDKVTITWTDASGTSHHASVTLTKGPPA